MRYVDDGSFTLTNSDNGSNYKKVVMNIRVATAHGKLGNREFTPVLVLSGRGGGTPVLVLTRVPPLLPPPPPEGTWDQRLTCPLAPRKDLGAETAVPPPEGTLDQRLEYPPPPPEGTLDQRLGYPPPPVDITFPRTLYAGRKYEYTQEIYLQPF